MKPTEGIKNESLTAAYQHSFVFPFERGLPDEEISKFLLDYWPHTITISVGYLALLYSIQWAMRDRKPFELRRPLMLWNGALAVFSIFGAIRVSEEFFHILFHRGFYPTICYSMHTKSVTAHWYLFFAVSKIFELVDSLFIVARKRKLTFLHAYHHCSVLVFTINAGAEHIAAGRCYMWMNLVAHSLMYTYYFFVSAGFRVDRSIAKVVTSVQLLQMFCGIFISVAVFIAKYVLHLPCKQTNTNLLLTAVLYVSYCALFLNFWYHTYRVPSAAAAKTNGTAKKSD